jgi:cytochrome P450 family 144
MSPKTTASDPLFDPAIMQDPYDYYQYLRENDPVHEITGSGGAFLVTRAETIFDVVRRTEVFSSMSGEFLHKGDWPTPALRSLTGAGYAAAADEAGGGGGLAGADPPAHGRQRTVVSRKLSTATMRAMEPEFSALMDNAMTEVLPDGRFEWMSSVAEPLPMVMVARILGLPDSLAPHLKKQGYESLERISGFVSEERIAEIEQDSMTDFAPVIEAYTGAKEDGAPYAGTMIGILAQAVVDGELNDFEAMSILNVLIAAGGESTTSLTGTAVRILAERADLQDQLRADPSLVPAFVEEACRFDPPFRGHYRTVTRDVELDGKSVPAGSHLILMWPAANRDPAVYDHPNEVRLDRPNPRQHLGFGWGIHLCVGAPLARVEAKVAIETLLDRTRAFRIDPLAPLPLRYHLNLMVRRLVSLPLLLEMAS